MNKITFTNKAWEEYCYWQKQDKKRINQLLEDIIRNGFIGIGKPEPLKNNLSGLWSRRIDDYNRLVYRIKDNQVEIIQCKNHYNE